MCIGSTRFLETAAVHKQGQTHFYAEDGPTVPWAKTTQISRSMSCCRRRKDARRLKTISGYRVPPVHTINKCQRRPTTIRLAPSQICLFSLEVVRVFHSTRSVPVRRRRLVGALQPQRMAGKITRRFAENLTVRPALPLDVVLL